MPETCSKCKTRLDEDAVFCPECAAPVNPTCPKCEKPIVLDAKFCKYCAFDLSQSVSNKAETVPEKRPVAYPQYASGVDFLLADKYRAMSDSELLATARGDLSAHTEKTLSIALEELETRKNLDWRDAEVAKTRLRETIIRRNSKSSYGNYSYEGSANAATEKASRLMKAGGITAGVSALFFLWGYNYTSNFANAARAGLMNLTGQADSTYQFASLCVGVGAIGFFAGLILFLVGIAQKNS